MKKLQCELCNGTDFTKDGDYFVCDYCRAKYSTQQAQKMIIEGTVDVAGTVQVDRRNDVANLILLAKSALEGSNANEAYEYANRALEIDPNNWEAWACKGKAAGWSSTLQNFRVSEMVNALNSALRLAPEADRDELKAEWADDLNSIAIAVHNLSWKHTNDFIQVDNTWQEHINRCQQIFPVLDLAYQWGGEKIALQNTIAIASNLIAGIAFKDYAGQPKTVFLQPAYQQQMQNLINRTSEEMRKFDPSYVAPQPKRAGSCFVVTATMGNESSFPVVTMRCSRIRPPVAVSSGGTDTMVRGSRR